MRRFLCLISVLPGCCLAFGAAPQLQGDSIAPLPAAEELTDAAAADSKEIKREAIADRSRDWLAGYLNDLSGGIDSFFVDTFFSEDVANDDVLGSRAQISLYTRREIGEPVDYRFGLSVKVVLPNTNERFNLLFESQDDEDAREADPLESVENTEYTTALRYILNETDKWKTNLDAGVRWGVPPDPFVRFRARRYAYLSEWELRATQSVFYYTQDGAGESSQLRADYPINVEKLFRINMDAEYMEQDDFFSLGYSAALYHELSPTRGMAYVAGATGSTEFGATFDSYFAGLRYRQLVYSDWVFAEVNPEFIWTSDGEYETTPVIMLRLEGVISQ
ncbi:MAG: hypothetical protein CMI10_17590 [Oceanospirillaceae bacterium]|nr:hypothetical protein [Oceanospirillaceae bacterium]